MFYVEHSLFCKNFRKQTDNLRAGETPENSSTSIAAADRLLEIDGATK